MKTFKSFLIEQSPKYSILQQFIIKSWGELLYIDYFSLPNGADNNTEPEIRMITGFAHEYFDIIKYGNQDSLEEFNEWVSEGCPINDTKLMGKEISKQKILTRQTVDSILNSAQHKAGKNMTIYRFDKDDNKLKPNSWISTTSDENSDYPGKKIAYNIDPDDLIIDAHGYADNNEIIVNTNLLINKKAIK